MYILPYYNTRHIMSQTICDFCDQTFFDKSNLNRHLKTSLTCLEIRAKIANKCICIHCKKEYSTTYTLNKHYKVCKILNESKEIEKDKINNEFIQLKINYASIESENKLLKHQLEDLKQTSNEQLKDLKSSYENLLEKFSQSKNVTNNNSTNNNLTIKQIVSKLEPISYEEL